MKPASRILLAVFADGHDAVHAVSAARAEGWIIEEVYAPFPVHGLAEAMGFHRTRLPIACFFFGLAGLFVSLAFQYWTTAIAWPINIGGKPWNSLPAFLPVSFEMMVLLAGLGVVATFLVVAGLYPGRTSRARLPEASDDKIVMVLHVSDATHDLGSALRFFPPLGAERVEERVER